MRLNKSYFHIIVLVTALSKVSAQGSIKIPNPRIHKVVLGVGVLKSTKWPWQVFIEFNNGGNQCGGTLISHQWILTAAHCFDGQKKITKILMGTNLKSGKSNTAVNGKAEKICCHQNYDPITLDHDICLIKLKKAPASTSSVKPISLPRKTRSKLADGTVCYVTGWGYDENYDLPEILQEATVKIVERKKCIAWHKSKNVTVVDHTICAGHEKGGADSCGGDSGGPLTCKNSAGTFILQGITSYGPSYCGSARSPGIYTKVSDYLKWIDYNRKNSCQISFWRNWGRWSACRAINRRRLRTRMCLGKANAIGCAECDYMKN